MCYIFYTIFYFISWEGKVLNQPLMSGQTIKNGNETFELHEIFINNTKMYSKRDFFHENSWAMTFKFKNM